MNIEIGVSQSDEPAVAFYSPLVVVAEDDDDFRDFLCSQLTCQHLSLLPVADGQAAMDYIELAHAQPLELPFPSLLVTDLLMPRFSGLELIAANTTIPAIAMTGFGDRVSASDAERVGARYFFSKPFDWEDLRRAVWSLLDG